MPITIREIKILIHRNQLLEWDKHWRNLQTCKITRCFYPQVREDKRMTSLSVEELQEIAKVSTGHGLFKEHLAKWKEFDHNDTHCSLCNNDLEDSWHLWNNCQSLEHIRRELRLSMDMGMPLEVAIIRFTQADKYKSLMALNDTLISRDSDEPEN